MAPDAKVSYHWLISKKDDMAWIIGSSGVSLFLLSVYFFLMNVLPQISNIQLSSALVAGIIFLIWTFFFDSTHFFATYSRTYLDRIYHKDNKLMLYSSLLILLMGPMFLLTPFLMTEEQYQKNYSEAIFTLIIFGSLIWGYFHLVRQHWGMLALYQKKNSENKSIQYRLDAALLGIGCIWPFLFYLKQNLLNQPRLLMVIETFGTEGFIHYLMHLSALTLLAGFFLKGLTLKGMGSLGALSKLLLLIGIILLGLSVFIQLDFQITLESYLTSLELLFRFLFALSLLIYAGYYLFSNQDWNIPKFLLLASVLLTHNLVLLSVTNFLLISACLTIFHNIQYHRIVRYFNVNHYQGADQSSKYGLAVMLTNKLIYFVVFALAFSLIVTALRGSVVLTESGLIKMILITSVINGISLHHYFLDGIIWRTSKDQTLGGSLKLNKV